MSVSIILPQRKLITQQSVSAILREKIVWLLVVLFFTLVLVSAYLGWSATSTVNAIYLQASEFLRSTGQPVPDNPVLDISALSLLRNMSVYVMLIGSLASIVMGYQLIAQDRKAGVLTLINVRPVTRLTYARAKIQALIIIISVLMGLTAIISIATFLLLPEFYLSMMGWVKLAGFFILSAFYMLLFGLLALAATAGSRSEAVGLLLPVTVWLTLTFILPALTANIHPTAAINPIAALAPPPDTTIFNWLGKLLGPFSFAQSYSWLSAQLLDYLPVDSRSSSLLSPLVSLTLGLFMSVSIAIRYLLKMDIVRGDYHD